MRIQTLAPLEWSVTISAAWIEDAKRQLVENLDEFCPDDAGETGETEVWWGMPRFADLEFVLDDGHEGSLQISGVQKFEIELPKGGVFLDSLATFGDAKKSVERLLAPRIVELATLRSKLADAMRQGKGFGIVRTNDDVVPLSMEFHLPDDFRKYETAALILKSHHGLAVLERFVGLVVNGQPHLWTDGDPEFADVYNTSYYDKNGRLFMSHSVGAGWSDVSGT